MSIRLLRFATASIAASLLAVSAHAGPDWNAPQEPFAIYGNTYYVGTGGIAAVLVTSPAGHILIDGATLEAPEVIARHIRQLGFHIEDVRYILDSHEHPDHAGGIAGLQKLSGATVVASPVALAVLTSGRPDPGDPQAPGIGRLMPMQPLPPGARTRAVRDGEILTIGPLAVTAHATPGHTRGGTTWTWRSSENGKEVAMVYADSLNAIALDETRFDGNPGYPSARAELERSMATVAALPCDVLVSAHPEASGLWVRKARQPRLGNAAFIDRGACQAYVATARGRLAQTLAEDAKKAAH